MVNQNLPRHGGYDGRTEKIMLIVYEVDYHERARKIGTASTMKEAKKIR